jgi:hypothetical protein
MYNQLQPQLAALQQQLDILRTQTTQPTNYNQTTEQSIQALVNKTVQAALQPYLPQTQQTVAESDKVAHNTQLTPHQQLLSTIGDFLTQILPPEQVKFLSDPVIVQGVPMFLKSTKGKEAVSMLVDEYQSYVNR